MLYSVSLSSWFLFCFKRLSDNSHQALEAAGAGELQREKEREKEKAQVRMICNIVLTARIIRTILMLMMVIIITLMLMLINCLEGDQDGRGGRQALGGGQEGEKGAGERAQWREILMKMMMRSGKRMMIILWSVLIRNVWSEALLFLKLPFKR